LRLKDGLAEVNQPLGDIERALMAFELVVVGFAAMLDCIGKRNQAWVPYILR
jgi:hypothetical protein